MAGDARLCHVRGLSHAFLGAACLLGWVLGPADAAAWGQEEEPPPVEGALLARLPALAECFEQGCVQDVLAALRARPGEPWAAEAVQALEKCGLHCQLPCTAS